MSEHKKHVQLVRPEMGNFSKAEWSIHGAPCDLIQTTVHEWITLINKKYKTGFLDASHAAGAEPLSPVPNFHVRTKPEGMDTFQSYPVLDNDLQIYFKDKGILFINGNHFTGKKQIVILDPRKEESLERKIDRLTDVELVLTTDEVDTPYEFLSSVLPENVPVLSLYDKNAVAEWIDEQMKKRKPVLKGLVLVGGKSVRMGEDKGAIQYHEKDQREHTAELLSDFCEEVYLSCRPDQTDEIKSAFPLLPDSFLGLGPLGAILSAFRLDPNAAWLVVACDLPLLDRNSLDQLVSKRDPEAIATAFKGSENKFPEPLITIWEPAAYSRMLDFLGIGHSCPRKVLINSNTNVVIPANDEVLTNVNTEEEKKEVMDKLAK